MEVEDEPMIKTEKEDDEDDALTPQVYSGNPDSADHVLGTIIIPSDCIEVKNELPSTNNVPIDATDEASFNYDTGNSSFKQEDMPNSLFECCYCKVLFCDAETLTNHLEEFHEDMDDIKSILGKLATDRELYKVERKVMEEKAFEVHGDVKNRSDCILLTEGSGMEQDDVLSPQLHIGRPHFSEIKDTDGEPMMAKDIETEKDNDDTLSPQIYTVPDGIAVTSEYTEIGELSSSNDALPDCNDEESLIHDISSASFEEEDMSDSLFECCYCKVLFADAETLTKHLEDSHTDMDDIKSILEKLATDIELYKMETKAKEVEGIQAPPGGDKKRRRRNRVFTNSSLVCEYPGCEKKFTKVSAFRTHQVVHEVSRECPHCGVEFSNITGLLRHVDRRHNVQNAQRFDCLFPACGKTFTAPLTLKRHQRSHNYNKTCFLCGMVFPEVSGIQYHLKVVHALEFGNLTECANCFQKMTAEFVEPHQQRFCAGGCSGLGHINQEPDEESFSETALDNYEIGPENQEMTHQPLNEHEDVDDEEEKTVKYECSHEACSQKYATKRKLAWHLKYTLHHGTLFNEEPFHCPYKVCTLHFADKEAVCAHMRAEHWGTKKVRLAAATKLAKEQRQAEMKGKVQKLLACKCPVCCERFPTECEMKVHLKSAHVDEVVDKDDKHKETEESTLVNQVNTRSEMEEEAATEKKKDVLFNLHMFKCPLCHISYHVLSGLVYHLKNHHKKCENAVIHLSELETNSDAFVHVVPSTLYGDSFKDKRRKAKDNISQETQYQRDGHKEVIKKSGLDFSDLDGKSEQDDFDTNSASKDDSICKEDSMEDGDILSGDKEMVDLEDDTEILNDTEENMNISTEETEPNNSPEKPGYESPDGRLIVGKKSYKLTKLICRYPGCNEVHTSRFELMRHQRTHEKLLKCPNEGCKQEFFNTSNLRLHIQLVHTEAQDATCRECGLVGKRAYIVYRHPKTCPKKVDLTCQKCSKVFEKISSYTNHIRSHDKKPSSKHACQYEGCEKKFKTRQDRDRHHNVHSGARPHACPYENCGKTYKQRPHLLVHIKNSHTIRTEEKKTFPCEYCGYDFATSCGRLKHIRKSCTEGPNKETILANRKRAPTKAEKTPSVSDREENA